MELAVERFDVLELSRGRSLLGEDAMKLGIDAMRFHRDGDKLAHALFNRLRGNLPFPDRLTDFLKAEDAHTQRNALAEVVP